MAFTKKDKSLFMISKAYHTNLEEKYYDSRIKENAPDDSSYQNLSDQLMNNAHRYFEEKVLDFINDHLGR